MHASKFSTDAKPEPIIVISTVNAIQPEYILSTLSKFAELDDVYTEEFGNSLAIQTVANSGDLFITLNVQLIKRFTSVRISEVESEDHLLPSGPYFQQDSRIHQAWRLYPDDLNAFVLTVIPNNVRSPTRYSGQL